MGIQQRKFIIMILLACGILAYSFHSFWQNDSTEQELPTVAPASENSPSANNGPDGEFVVYVCGAVNKPGVYKLPQRSRVVDAVTLAGGFAPGADAAKINLALRIKDEMQINVPNTPTPAINGNPNLGGAAGSSAVGNNSDKININTATAAELDKLPGIGPALAERIAQYRTANGLFSDVADIKKVPGIGEAKYNQFKDKISL
ncbi:ComEA family DNA-binding protein [Sporomusa acidovorans]|uniref:ComE operon protein 1 n=1 Tax=Sporomusa acidovorans (strain ATCC 49682 / DSM 3132 / Mol) TaxID=1123286 RepID=A0ABZ3J4I7_SPOA4|nr:ComEA family DNA-binding protein [Sporomusa acidovorans]OZC23100.1 ComE operon protein 1 [Sporomusa acidovorans DSM 3132]SDF05527.1 competence protein ComEA [Sporomusa acidovorans]